MNKALLLAKVRLWKAELVDVIETLNGEGKSGPIIHLLDKRCKEMDELIAMIEEKNFMPKDAEAFEPEPVMEEIKEKVKKVKEGVRKIKKLSDEKTKIIDDLTKDI
ncbi:MAG: hypothetical protein JW938_05660 [Candidatus Omnitrophica bacterium]|nr:hypothetical protein [Candidatus Omnitrophota bacterium]